MSTSEKQQRDVRRCDKCGSKELDGALRELRNKRYCHDCWMYEVYKTENGLRETQQGEPWEMPTAAETALFALDVLLYLLLVIAVLAMGAIPMSMIL